MRQSVIVPNTVDVVAPSWRQLKAWPAGTTASHLGEAAGPPVIAPAAAPAAANTAQRWQDRYSQGLRISDSVIVFASVLLAQYVRFGRSRTPRVTRTRP